MLYFPAQIARFVQKCAKLPLIFFKHCTFFLLVCNIIRTFAADFNKSLFKEYENN